MDEAVVRISAVAETTAQTGVEMEALTAATVAALTVYDMAKAIDKSLVIADVRLVEKTKTVKAAVLTVSDGVAAGTREDESGDLLAALLAVDGLRGRAPRRRRRPRRDRARAHRADVGRSARADDGRHRCRPRDVTPEATASVLERVAPGIAEAIRADAIAKTPHGLLSRGVAGVRGSALVVNLPGSTGGCRDGYAVLRPALDHALRLLSDEATEHVQT